MTNEIERDNFLDEGIISKINEYGELVLPASEREGDEDFWKSAYERKYGKLE